MMTQVWQHGNLEDVITEHEANQLIREGTYRRVGTDAIALIPPEEK